MFRATQSALKPKGSKVGGKVRFVERQRNDPFVRARETGQQPGRTKLPIWARQLKSSPGSSSSSTKNRPSPRDAQRQNAKDDQDVSSALAAAVEESSSEGVHNSHRVSRPAHLARLVMDDVTAWRARSAFKLMELQKGTRMLSPPLNVGGGAGVAAALERAHQSGRAVRVEAASHGPLVPAHNNPLGTQSQEQVTSRQRVVPWTVVDLGAAPGGWSQVCARALSWWESTRAIKRGVKLGWHVFGIDLLPVSDVPGATFLRGDFLAQDTRKQLRSQVLAAQPPPNPKAQGDSAGAFRAAVLSPSTSVAKDAETGRTLSGGLVDVCLSDMLGNVSGVDARDETVSIELVDAAFRFARVTLRWPPPLPLPERKSTKPRSWELEEASRFEDPPSQGIWEDDMKAEAGVDLGSAPESQDTEDNQEEDHHKSPDEKGSKQISVPRTTFFVAKVYQSRMSDLYIQQVLRPFFERLSLAKPEASRAVSREQFIIASGFKGPHAADYPTLRERFADRHGI